jgi:hypothetical protein
MDPMGADPNDLAKHRRKQPDILSEFEVPGAWVSRGPRVRHADYDSPEALSRPAAQPGQTNTALTRSAHGAPKGTRFERAMGMARSMMPLVGKMLPLLEGNVVGAAANLLGNRPVQEVNLKPMEEAIARLQTEQRALTFHTSEQKRALRILEEDFAELKAAVEKNAADQAELIEGVVKLAKRTSSFMRLVVILLVASILFTALLCVRIAYIIRF